MEHDGFLYSSLHGGSDALPGKSVGDLVISFPVAIISRRSPLPVSLSQRSCEVQRLDNSTLLVFPLLR